MLLPIRHSMSNYETPSPESIESSDGFRGWPSSDGFRHWGFLFSVPVSVTGIWRFPALGFYFHSVLGRLDVLPAVGGRRRRFVGVFVGEPKQIRLTKLGISCAACFGDFEEAERNSFADGWRN